MRAAGGVTSVAHAVWYKDADGLIRALAAEGLGAIEVFHPDHGPDEERRFLALSRELDLATTAGSDFHGTVEGRKKPGAVFGDARMLEALRARRPLARSRRRGAAHGHQLSDPGASDDPVENVRRPCRNLC